jgi:diguanylate cyclase (GGDEF)-like protein
MGPAFAVRLRRTLACVTLVAAALFAFGTRELLEVQARHSAAAQARLAAAALVPATNGDLSESVARVREHFPGLIAAATLTVSGSLDTVYPGGLAHRELIRRAMADRQADPQQSTTTTVGPALTLPSPQDGRWLEALAVSVPINGSSSPAAQRVLFLLEYAPYPLGWVEATTAFVLLAVTLAFMSHLSLYRWFERAVAGPLEAMAGVFAHPDAAVDRIPLRSIAGWRETALIAKRFDELVWSAAQSVAQAEQVKKEARQRLREREQGFDRMLRRAHDKASIDPLTGLRNRTFLEERLEMLFEQLRKRGNEFSFVMLDVDNFKHYNDTHGHQVGDALLRFVGALLKGTLRGTDHAVRYGGDEFLLILAETNSHAAAVTADRIVRLFSQYVSRLGQARGLSMSAGVAAQIAHQCPSGHALVNAADRALYAAKRAGKNRVSVQAIPAKADAPPADKPVVEPAPRSVVAG